MNSVRFKRSLSHFVDRGVGRARHHAAVAERARAEFHAALEPAHDPAGVHRLRGFFDQRVLGQLLVGQLAVVELGSNRIRVEFGPPEHALERVLFAAQEAGLVALERQQRTAQRVAGIGHRRIDEDGIDLGRRGDALVELDVGEYAAVQRHLAQAGFAQELAHQSDRRLFEHPLRRRGDVFPRMTLDCLAQVFGARVLGAFQSGEVGIEAVAVGREAQRPLERVVQRLGIAVGGQSQHLAFMAHRREAQQLRDLGVEISRRGTGDVGRMPAGELAARVGARGVVHEQVAAAVHDDHRAVAESRVERRRDGMGQVVVEELHLGLGAVALLLEEQALAEIGLERLAAAGKAHQHVVDPELAVRGATGKALREPGHLALEFLEGAVARHVFLGIESVEQPDMGHVAARDPAHFEHRVDRSLRQVLAVRFKARQALLGNRRDELAVPEQRRRGVVR